MIDRRVRSTLAAVTAAKAHSSRMYANAGRIRLALNVYFGSRRFAAATTAQSAAGAGQGR
jgi:hypothetical protein